MKLHCAEAQKSPAVWGSVSDYTANVYADQYSHRPLVCQSFVLVQYPGDTLPALFNRVVSSIHMV